MSSVSERVVLPLLAVPRHYTLELSPDLEALTFDGNVEVDVNVTEPIKDITLHSREIEVLSVEFRSSNGQAVEMEELSYHRVHHTVKFGFASELPVGEGKLAIKYKGILNSDMAGFYKSTYTDADGKKKTMASTQFEALDARRALPCWDEPAVKATFTVIITLPAHLTALSNMPETETRHIAGGKKRVTFAVSPRMSTYLLAWAVGEFDFVAGTTKNGVQLRVFAPPGRAAHCQFALDCGIRALDFYDDFFQVPYPLPKLDMISITEFAMGAMENWGLVTYREVALMIDPVKASSAQKQRVALVIAHELAHQWFGNLVTMSWWDGLWLNEGFAAWMQQFATDALYPEYKVWEAWTNDSFGAAQRLDSLKTSHPVIVPIKHAEEVEQVFDAISYCKGSTVVNMVHALVGAEHFQKGLQLYMRKHAYGNTETKDLWAAWSEVSGLDVAGIMHRWTTRMGYPYLRVVSETYAADSVTVTLEQNWFLADGSTPTEAESADALWHIPLLFTTSTSSSNQAVIMTEKQQTFSIPLTSADDWLRINGGQKALVRVALSGEQMRRLIPAIRSKALSPVDRAALLLDAYALAKANFGPIEAVVDLLRAYENEDSSVVWDAISGVLNALYLLLETSGAAFDRFVEFGKKLVVGAFNRVGWDVKPTDGHTDNLTRASLIALLDTFASTDAGIVSECKRRFDGHWENPSLLPSEYRAIVYKIILKNGGEAEYDAILKTYYSTEDIAEKRYAYSLGAASSDALKLRTLDWAVKSEDVKTQDFFYPIGGVAASARGAALAWDYFQQNFDAIKDRLSKAAPALMDAVIVNVIGRFTTFEQADAVVAFFEQHPLPSSTRRISQTVETIRTNAALGLKLQGSPLVVPSYWN